jgi:NitT/TauT family transport system ATP-binding protein
VSSAVAEISFENVSKMFPGSNEREDDIYAVRDLSFEVKPGELVAVMGKTGSGKSTMFSLLLGIIQPSHGRVLVKGHDPYRDFGWFRGKIGTVFQNDRLMPWRTAVENAAYGLELNQVPYEKRIAVASSWLKRLGLEGHEHDYPHALSGGMRQRVSVARAFAIRPEILLCDEPFSALDEMTARDLRAEFVRLVRQSNKTAVFITHQINEAMEIGDRVLVFHRPARIAYEARMQAGSSEAEREKVRGEIMQVLAIDRASGDSP